MRALVALASLASALVALASLASALVALGGCAELRAVVAPPGDLEDYRAFRVAAAEGTRLSRAKSYVERHPNGTWIEEVSASFAAEEPRYFEKAQGSREGLRRYLADLPDGPHAEAALALLVAFGSSMKDAELRDLARHVRAEDTKLETAAVQRRAVGEAILAAVGVFLDEDVYGAPLAEAPPKLRALLHGKTAPTWGAVPARREEDYFFLLPTRPERESRLLTLVLAVDEADGMVVSARIEGADLLVRWAEAERLVRLDASAAEDRAQAQSFAMARLEGALERRFPSASCEDRRGAGELLHRACGGWKAIVTAGAAAGDKDVVTVCAPTPRPSRDACSSADRGKTPESRPDAPNGAPRSIGNLR